jgi:hypothetical protein
VRAGATDVEEHAKMAGSDAVYVYDVGAAKHREAHRLVEFLRQALQIGAGDLADFELVDRV